MLTTLTIISCLAYVGSAGLPAASLLRRGIRAQCPPKPPTVSTLDLQAYLGNWYEQKRIPASFQLNTRCVRATYGLNDEGVVTVHNVATKEDGSLDEVFGTAYVPDPAFPGELLVDFPQSPVDGAYWILDTDYENYSIVYSCVDYIFGLVHFEFAWILGREKNMDPALIQEGVDLMAGYGISVELMEDTVQTEDCYYGED